MRNDIVFVAGASSVAGLARSTESPSAASPIVSRLAAVIEARSVPLSPAARIAIGGDSNCLATALTGGDDYEILFTASPSASAQIGELSRLLGVPITPLGRMRVAEADEPRVVVLDTLGRPLRFSSEGWTHFSTSP